MIKKSPLNIISFEKKDKNGTSQQKKNKREITKAHFERMWLQTPEKFDPERNVLEKERIKRTWQLILDEVSFDNLKACDLGCGKAKISFLLAEKGAEIDAIDIASNALKKINAHPNIHPKQDFVPKTVLVDESYNLVIALDLIAYLDVEDYRLFVSELARLVKPDGYVIASTPIDFRSENALERFDALVESEFDIDIWLYSYHSLFIKLKDILKSPNRFAKAASDNNYRDACIKARFGLAKSWFQLNSLKPISYFWKIVAFATNPLLANLNQSHFLLSAMENLTKRFKGLNGISHAIFIGKKRPIISPLKDEEVPLERKTKKQVWE